MILPLDLDYIPDEFIKKAEKELGETIQKREDCLRDLRKRIEREQDIPYSLDDDVLIMFLRARKFDVDRALIILRRNLQLGESIKKLGGKFCLDICIKVFQDNFYTILPYRDDDGCILTMFTVCNFDTKNLKFVDILSATIPIYMASLLFHPLTQISGTKIIVDCRGMSINHIRNVDLKVLKYFFTSLTDTFCLRIKAAYIFCDSRVVPNLWKITKYFLSKKIQNRVCVYGSDIKDLHNHFKDEILPTELGGTLVHNKEEFVETLKKFRSRDDAKFFIDFE